MSRKKETLGKKIYAKNAFPFVSIAPETISESRMHSVKFFLHYGKMHSQLRYGLRRYTDEK
jgi:hypothetical protein